MPITVANDTEVPVTVGTCTDRHTGLPNRGRAIRDIRIPPRGKVSLRSRVTLVGSGSLAVSGQLLTPGYSHTWATGAGGPSHHRLDFPGSGRGICFPVAAHLPRGVSLCVRRCEKRAGLMMSAAILP